MQLPAQQHELSRAPHGARGLKFPVPQGAGGAAESRPAWGAWIEMLCAASPPSRLEVAPRMGRVD